MKAEVYFGALEAIHQLWEAMDRNDHGTILRLLSPDCRWLREGWCVGRDAISASLELRGKKVTRHLVTNLRVREAEGLLNCRYTLLFFGHELAEGQVPPFKTTGPRAADYWVTLLPHEGGWRFSELRGELIFDRVDTLIADVVNRPGVGESTRRGDLPDAKA
jgi:hypothetical protein